MKPVAFPFGMLQNGIVMKAETGSIVECFAGLPSGATSLGGIHAGIPIRTAAATWGTCSRPSIPPSDAHVERLSPITIDIVKISSTHIIYY